MTSATSVPIFLLVCDIMMCLPRHRRACDLVLKTTGSFLSSRNLWLTIYVLFQCSTKAEWTPYENDERCFYSTFDLGSVHNVPSGKVGTRKCDANNIVNPGRVLPSRKLSWISPAERLVAFDQMYAVMPMEEAERADEEPPPDNIIEYLLAIDADADDDWDLLDVLTSGAIYVWFSLGSAFWIIQEKCHVYGLDEAVNP